MSMSLQPGTNGRMRAGIALFDNRSDDPCERQRDRDGDGRQDQALDQELPEQADASGADRQAQRDLALAIPPAREQQVRDVRAADHQHEQRANLNHAENLVHARIDHPARERLDEGREALVFVSGAAAAGDRR